MRSPQMPLALLLAFLGVNGASASGSSDEQFKYYNSQQLREARYLMLGKCAAVKKSWARRSQNILRLGLLANKGNAQNLLSNIEASRCFPSGLESSAVNRFDPGDSIRVNLRDFRFGFFTALYRIKYAQSEPQEIGNAEKIDFANEFDDQVSEQVIAAIKDRSLGHCLVRSDQSAAHQLVLSEQEAVWDQYTVPKHCFKRLSHTLSSPGIFEVRGMMAEALFRIREAQPTNA